MSASSHDSISLTTTRKCIPGRGCGSQFATTVGGHSNLVSMKSTNVKYSIPCADWLKPESLVWMYPIPRRPNVTPAECPTWSISRAPTAASMSPSTNRFIVAN